METIIALLNRRESFQPALDKFKTLGIQEENIHLYADPTAVKKLIGCEPECVIKNYTLYGAALGIAVYAIFGLAAAVCQCGLMHFGKEYGMFALVGALLAGVFVGGFIGFLVGAGKVDEETRLYLQGIRQGGAVISIQVSESQIDRARQILSNENISGMQVIQPNKNLHYGD